MRFLESNKQRLTLISAVAMIVILTLQLPMALADSVKTPGVAQASASTASPNVTKTLTSPNAQIIGEFGWSVAIGGKTVVVGAAFENGGASSAGRAYTFSAKTGLVGSTLPSRTPQSNGHFGYSVAVSGSIVVIGAPYETAGGLNNAGNAFIFNSKTGTWISLTSPSPAFDGYFGDSVAVSGKTVVVGAPLETFSGVVGAGNVYTYNAMTGKLLRTFDSPNAQSSGTFGLSVAINDTTMVVGAPYESYNGLAAAGQAYIFNAKTGAGISGLYSRNAVAHGLFGYSVAVGLGTVAVGAPYETASGLAAGGHAYTFNPGNGAVVSILTSPNLQASGFFGYSVAVGGSPVGTVVVGAPYESLGGPFSDAGRAYTFNAGTGAPISTLISPNAQNTGFFGWSVAISGKAVVVGAPYETANTLGIAGHAYIF
jgi:hypothetical protein